MTVDPWFNCLSCGHSFSLPAGDPFDDGSVSEEDRLICVRDQEKPRCVRENWHCVEHTFTALCAETVKSPDQI